MDAQKGKELQKAAGKVVGIAIDTIGGLIDAADKSPLKQDKGKKLFKAAQRTILNWNDVKLVGTAVKEFAGDKIIPVAKQVAPIAKDIVVSIAKVVLKK